MRAPSRVFNHSLFSPMNSFNLANDIAMIELPQALEFNGNVGKVELATTRPNDGDYVGQMVTLTGLGKPSDSATGISEVLREVTVPLISNADCDAVYGIINDGIICFDSDGGMGSCNGDSGGPMNYQGTVAGVTSFGSSAGCEAGYPGGYSGAVFLFRI